jgi:hypothetical protein
LSADAAAPGGDFVLHPEAMPTVSPFPRGPWAQQRAGAELEGVVHVRQVAMPVDGQPPVVFDLRVGLDDPETLRCPDA